MAIVQGWGLGWNMYLNQDVNKGRCYEDQELDTPCREGPYRDSEIPPSWALPTPKSMKVLILVSLLPGDLTTLRWGQ